MLLQLLYEEEILRNPYSLRHWWRYLNDSKDMSQVREGKLGGPGGMNLLTG